MNAISPETAAAMLQSIITTPPAETHRPLVRDVAPAPEFPVSAMLELVQPTKALQYETQAPMAMCAQAILAAVSAAVSPHYDVEPPVGGTKPLTLMQLTIAESGERKSTVMALAMRAITQKQSQLRVLYGHEYNDYLISLAAWKAATEEAKASKKKEGLEAVKAALKAIGHEPKPPAPAILMFSDLTIEGVTDVLAARPYGTIVTAEGGQFIGGHGMSKDSKTRTTTTLNAAWSGESITRIRSNRTIHLENVRLGFHVMVQPGLAAQIVADDELLDSGFTARLLVAAPDGTAGFRPFRERGEVCCRLLDAFDERLRYFLDSQPHLKEGGGLNPIPLTFTNDDRDSAHDEFIEFHNAVELENRKGGKYHQIKGFANKMPEHASRLAALLALYEGDEKITWRHFWAGCRLAEYFALEHLRLVDAGTVDPELVKATKLLEWWQARPDGRCHLAEVYQRGPACMRDSTTARASIEVLIANGWIEPLPPNVMLDGKPRRDAWRLIPKVEN